MTKRKCQIFVEYTRYFAGITSSINIELLAKLSATSFVAQLAEHYTRFTGLWIRLPTGGSRLAFFAAYLGWVLNMDYDDFPTTRKSILIITYTLTNTEIEDAFTRTMLFLTIVIPVYARIPRQSMFNLWSLTYIRLDSWTTWKLSPRQCRWSWVLVFMVLTIDWYRWVVLHVLPTTNQMLCIPRNGTLFETNRC